MTSETEQAFFGRIKQALTDRGEPVALPTDLQVARTIQTSDDAVDVFAARVDQSGMHAHRVQGESGLVEKVAELVRTLGAKTALVPAEDTPAREQIIAKIQEAGVTLVDNDNPDIAFDADVGITAVRQAVAETASLSVTSGDQRRRLASQAVPNHIAVVRAEQIIPDLLDWAADAPSNPPANEVLISGPSKTADIEMILVEGVHGPEVVHVVIVE